MVVKTTVNLVAVDVLVDVTRESAKALAEVAVPQAVHLNCCFLETNLDPSQIDTNIYTPSTQSQ